MISGIVQGVGFRPFVYNLARSLGLKGTVCNSGRGVLIEVEGREELVHRFIAGVRSDPPFLARISNCSVTSQPLRGYETFEIIPTRGSATGESVVPPDVATCPECRREMLDPADRHFGYPFTNCTRCGPRFTIIKSLPYDRAYTSMAGFAMCADCAREYGDPSDRRFHAQPVACPACGPGVWLVDRLGNVLEGDWLERARNLLAGGKIIAVKSLGGFHLACNGLDPAAIGLLRRRKGRPARPLAIMCRDMEVVKENCRVSPVEEQLLQSPSAPVVVLEKKPSSNLPEALSPGLSTVGVMLPYTPLHLLLLKTGPPVLVMTSGNPTGLPLAAGNREALATLSGIADYFLLHDREIVNRCDDSVVQVVDGQTQFFRRSRGYVPWPVMVNTGDVDPGETVFLGAGGDMKNTFCLFKAGRAYLSQHIGSVDNLEGLNNYQTAMEKFFQLVQARPAVVGYDLHPGYRTAKQARSLAAGAVGVQHHHAHMASCMAENGLDGDVLGIILDGTGYGLDGRIWGFELLRGGYLRFTREYHLAYVPLPGGERAVRNPWITAVAYLTGAMGDDGYGLAEKIFADRLKELPLIARMLERKVNAPPASSCGRLFDAVSALLGICRENTYDGQAAIELGEKVPAVFSGPLEPYPFRIEGDTIGVAPLFVALVRDVMDNDVAPEHIARRFHDTVIAMVVEAAERARFKSGLNRVVLSGGCWHNRYLLTGTCRVLREKDFTVYTHGKVPPGDGGLALGQVMVARRKWLHQPGG